MGYYPWLRPGGGDGFSSIQGFMGDGSQGFSGNIITLNPLPLDSVFASFYVVGMRARSNMSTGYTGVILGKGFIDFITHDFQSQYAGARMVNAPLEPYGSESKNLLGNTPGNFLVLPEQLAYINNYTGPGNLFTVYSSVSNIVGMYLRMFIVMHLFRK